MKKLIAAVAGLALGGLSVWLSHLAGIEVTLGLIMTLLLAQGFSDRWARFEENQRAKAFRNEVRGRLDRIEKVPEPLRSEME